MNRKDFMKTSAILGGVSLLPTNTAFPQSLQQSGLDKDQFVN
jgi:Fe-Mn family superoxide dismutase